MATTNDRLKRSGRASITRAGVKSARLRHIGLSLNSALERAVRMWPNRVFLRIEKQDVTFATFDASVGRLAAGLQTRGLARGERLSVFMRNSVACVQTWFAANRLGAVWAPINTEFRGSSLRGVVELANPRMIVCDANLYPELIAALPDIKCPVLLAGRSDEINSAERFEDCFHSSPVPPAEVADNETAAFLFTSGTTGRSKGAVLSHRYFVSQANIAIVDFGLREDDVSLP